MLPCVERTPGSPAPRDRRLTQPPGNAVPHRSRVPLHLPQATERPAPATGLPPPKEHPAWPHPPDGRGGRAPREINKRSGRPGKGPNPIDAQKCWRRARSDVSASAATSSKTAAHPGSAQPVGTAAWHPPAGCDRAPGLGASGRRRGGSGFVSPLAPFSMSPDNREGLLNRGQVARQVSGQVARQIWPQQVAPGRPPTIAECPGRLSPCDRNVRVSVVDAEAAGLDPPQA